MNDTEKMLEKACETLADMELDEICEALTCDDGWCEEHCSTDGTKPECVRRWLKKQIKEAQEGQ